MVIVCSRTATVLLVILTTIHQNSTNDAFKNVLGGLNFHPDSIISLPDAPERIKTETSMDKMSYIVVDK